MENIFNDINFGPDINKDSTTQGNLIGAADYSFGYDTEVECINKDNTTGYYNHSISYTVQDTDYSDNTILLIDDNGEDWWEDMENFIEY